MATFDIFIKGINPERADETDTIRVNSAKALQISLEKLDELLAQPNGVCIRRNAQEQEAINYQRALSKLGLICLYSPTKVLTNLELEPIEEETTAESITCPNCGHEMKVEEDIEPEKCTECGVEIQKFLAQKRKEEEREAMKAKLLASQTILKAQEEKKQQEEAEKQRKAELEKDVLQELGVDVIEKKPLNMKLLTIGGGLVAATVIGSYFFTASNNPPPKSMRMETPVANSTETGNVQLAAPLDSQQAMQKTHDQAAQVLNGFGLNPDAFANGGANSNAAPLSVVDNVLTASQPATATNTSNSQNNAVPVAKNSPAPQVETVATTKNLPELFAVLQNDIMWDKFLAQNSKILLERQLPENALQLSKFIISPEIYVSAIGELLRSAVQSKQTQLIENYLIALDTRFAKLPVQQQAIYFASAAVYLPLENGTNRLFVKAENLLSSLPKPELQFPAVLKLAVIYSKLGNITNANTYFNKINVLLTPITDLDLQAQLRADVATAYQDVNNTPVATQWLSSVEPLLKQLKPETVSSLVVSYAKCNQWQNALNVLSQLDSSKRDEVIYQAIQVSLKAGFVTSALELQKSLQSPVYQALSNLLLVEYAPSPTKFLTSAEQELNNLSPTEKILVASQLVDYYGRLKNTAQVEKFLTISQEALVNLPASNEKDALLDAVIKHYAHGFQTKTASNLLTAIQATPLKMRLNIEINELAGVSTLLK